VSYLLRIRKEKKKEKKVKRSVCILSESVPLSLRELREKDFGTIFGTGKIGKKK